MASSQEFIDFVFDHLDNEKVRYRKMFGEYGIYFLDKFVGLICDNRFYVKPTQNGKSFIGEVIEASPYPNAKKHFIIEEQLEDGEWMMELLQRTYDELPIPKPKKSRKK